MLVLMIMIGVMSLMALYACQLVYTGTAVAENVIKLDGRDRKWIGSHSHWELNENGDPILVETHVYEEYHRI